MFACSFDELFQLLAAYAAAIHFLLYPQTSLDI
jgi:hypothetical protein